MMKSSTRGNGWQNFGKYQNGIYEFYFQQKLRSK